MMGKSNIAINKMITLIDHDNIEKSNLIRENDIGKLRSECAVNSVQLMNNKINCFSIQEYADDKTEIIFNKEFFKSKMLL